jgi:hypothetical protein
VEKYRPTTQNEDVMCHYTSWHTNHKFCWRVDSKHGPTWIDQNSWEWWTNHSGWSSLPSGGSLANIVETTCNKKKGYNIFIVDKFCEKCTYNMMPFWIMQHVYM